MSKLSRRAFLAGAAGVAATATLPRWERFDTTSALELVERIVPIRDLPRPFEGYRIGFLADLHIGTNVPFELLDLSLEMLRKSAPDLLVLGGDLIAINDSVISQMMQRDCNTALKGLPQVSHPQLVYEGIASRLAGWQPPDGAFSVLGNHDRWVSPNLCIGTLGSLGHRVLVNELVEVRRAEATLQLYGTDDYWNGTPHLHDFPPPSTPGRELRIMANHNPDFTGLIQDKQAASFHLALSGHTHGGQVKLPLVGAISYNINDLRLAEGLFTFPDGTQSYTSRGIGVVEVPYRINCPPEVTVLQLSRA